MIRAYHLTIFACLIGCALMIGCVDSGPKTGTVSGKLTIGGAAPKEPVRVHFINSMIGQGASATTSADGTYKLDRAIQIGEYTVYFEKLVEASGPVSTSAEMLTSVPKAYRNEATSPLKQTVNEGANTIDIDVPT